MTNPNFPSSFDLSKFSIKRPEKIAWRFPEGDDLLSQIKSKSLRKFLAKSNDLLLTNGLNLEITELSKSQFLEWLPYYETKMKESEYDLLANEAWFDKKIGEKKKVKAIFIFQNQKLVGSLIFTVLDKEKATIAFRANDKLDIFSGGRSSIGSVLDYTFVNQMKAEGIQIISAGRSRNAFGVINSIGNLDYKLRFGMKPVVAANDSRHDSVPLNQEGYVLFFGEKSDQPLTLFAIKPSTAELSLEATHYATAEMPFELLEY